MPMSARLLRPRSTGFHPDAQAWRNAVIANGGSVSGGTLKAVSDFCRRIDAAGLRDRFYRLNLLAGTGLSSALVPLYRGQSRTGTQFGSSTDTNVGPFVSGDYTETGASGGLLGNGTSKYLNTGLAASTMPLGNAHLSAYVVSAPGSGSFPAAIGAFQAFSGQTTRELGLYHFQSNSGTASYYADENSVTGFVPAAVNNTTGLIMGSSLTTSDRRFYRNGTQSGSTNTGTLSATQQPANSIFVFARNTTTTDVPGSYSAGRLGAYSIGLGMTASQASDFYSALQAFQTSLGRNV